MSSRQSNVESTLKCVQLWLSGEYDMLHNGKNTWKDSFLIDRMQISVEMYAEELQLLLQLGYVVLSKNHLSRTLPSSWAELTKVNCAAKEILKVQLP